MPCSQFMHNEANVHQFRDPSKFYFHVVSESFYLFPFCWSWNMYLKTLFMDIVRWEVTMYVRTAFNFRQISLSALPWNSLKVDNTWSFIFNSETHNFRLWSSMNVTKYCDPTCDFVFTWHTSVCTSSNNAFRLIGGLARKEVRFCLPAKQLVHFSSCMFLTSGRRLSSASLRIPFWLMLHNLLSHNSSTLSIRD